MRKISLVCPVCIIIFFFQSADPSDSQSNMKVMDDFLDEMSNLMYKDPIMYKIQNKVKRAALYTKSQNEPTENNWSSDGHSNVVTKNQVLDSIHNSSGKIKISANAGRQYPLELHAQYKVNPKLLYIFTSDYVPPEPITMKIGQHSIKVTSAVNVEKFEPSGGYKIFINSNKGHQIEITKVTQTASSESPSHSSNENKSSGISLEGHDKVQNATEIVLKEETQSASGSITEPDITNGIEDREFFGFGNDSSEDEFESDADSVEEIDSFGEDAGEIVPFGEDEVSSDNELDVGFGNAHNQFMPLEGSGDGFNAEITSSEAENSMDKDGRLLSMFATGNETAVACTTPRGNPGHCRRIRQCLLSDALSNFNDFLQYLCLIRGARVGVCCPDNPVIEIQHPDNENSTEGTENDIEQPPEGCGASMKTRIVGGTTSLPHEWSWMVALMRRSRFFCGGVIINNWYILTAAHCVMGINVRDLTVRLGEYNFNERNEHQEDIPVAEIKRHAQFISLTFQHDIALLKLKQKVKYSRFISSICLPNDKSEQYDGVNGTVVGWGTVSFGGAASQILRQVTIPVWKNEDCDRTYALENINESFMCAGSPKNGEDACQGDSGGPLMAVNGNGRWVVIGIVSWGRRCGDPTYPGVYTRVTTYMDWIRQNSQ